MDAFWIMIIAVVVFALGGLITALYAWKLYKDFPTSVKAKVVSVEAIPNGEGKTGYRYHFKGRHNGTRMLTDTVVYKEKKFKTGEKVTVHMAAQGGSCHSNVPLWPVGGSIVCILMAIVSVFVYVNSTNATEVTENAIQYDMGYYIVTDTDVLFQGDSLGLVILDGDNSLVSTGDYGAMLYQEDAHDHSDSVLPVIHSLSSNVSTDGTYETLSADIVAEVEALGYVINTVATNSAELIEALEGTVIEEEVHDHEEVTVEVTGTTTEITDETTSETEATADDGESEESTGDVEEGTDSVVEYTTIPTETTTGTNN